MTSAVAGDHDARVGQHQQQRDCREVRQRSLAISLMIPTDSAEGAMHALNEDWGETAVPGAAICAHQLGVGRHQGQRRGGGWQGSGGGGCCNHRDGGGRRNGTAVNQPPANDLLPPNDVCAVVFPHGATSQAFQARRGGRD